MESQFNDSREKLKQELIRKIGPWAFQSFPKEKWHAAPDHIIIEGALLRAKPEDKLKLLHIFNLDQIKAVWQEHVVIQDDWFHDANLWAAKHIFNAQEPEKFVKLHYRKFHKLHMEGKLSF